MPCQLFFIDDHLCSSLAIEMCQSVCVCAHRSSAQQCQVLGRSQSGFGGHGESLIIIISVSRCNSLDDHIAVQ